ncbi:N-(5'-phosphoribosyl)anthranilate isomerase [Jannaschia marina]|uniref:N-(5'-phosphoribosyl)anthranilate isomerase n=1 Tax=Jannaschia marina TaxID=2741674 RepID=UPI0015CE0075|nr:N-(5'-phosphoribosyl)anthranilate isomerase [Jannaschia marina]
MSFLGPVHTNDEWVAQLFGAKAASTGGVVRRKVRDVERKIGRTRLELEVRQRGFRLIEAGDQFIVICTRAPMQVIV